MHTEHDRRHVFIGGDNVVDCVVCGEGLKHINHASVS